MSQIFTGKNVLVVDDEPDLREILRDELEFAGATLSEAANGLEALGMAKEKKFDAIISDIRMPGGDGMTLARQIKSQDGPTPVLFLVTGFADVIPAEAYEVGVEGFIHKPFNLGPVMENLSRAMKAEKGWATELNLANAKNLPLSGSFPDLIAAGQISMGRGGCFVKGNFADLRTNDVVTANLANQARFSGVVRWIQHGENGLPPGLGMEFMNLSDVAQKLAMDWVQKNQPKSYIPRR